MVKYSLKASDYAPLAVVGKGCDGTASVFFTKHKPSGTLIAIKRIDLDECTIDVNTLQHEIRMHRQLSNANIVPYLCSFVYQREIWSVMPMMSYGSCQDLIHAHFQDGLPEAAIAYIIRDVLNALQYLHYRNKVHRDVRASHILISGTGNVCLTGFRHSCNMLNAGKRISLHEIPSNFIKSLLWASPELLAQNLAGYDTKTDIYSLGMTACEMANGVVPFSDKPLTEMLLNKMEGVVPRLIDSVTISQMKLAQASSTNFSAEVVPTTKGSEATSVNNEEAPAEMRTFSTNFHSFVDNCLQFNPKARSSALQLIQHSFVKQLKKKTSIEELPKLLSPVRPIGSAAASELEKASEELEDLAQKLGQVNVDDIEWAF